MRPSILAGDLIAANVLIGAVYTPWNVASRSQGETWSKLADGLQPGAGATYPPSRRPPQGVVVVELLVIAVRD